MGTPTTDLVTKSFPARTRAKFAIRILNPFQNGGGEIRAAAVCPPYGEAGATHENKSFWDATPNGELTMHVQNPLGYAFFEGVGQGGEFYLDFVKP